MEISSEQCNDNNNKKIINVILLLEGLRVEKILPCMSSSRSSSFTVQMT